MALILDGTNGLSDVDGSAATPAIRGTDTNTGIFFPAADTIAFSEGGVESMRIDSSGNVGIGTASPSARLEVNAGTNTDIRVNTSGSGYLQLGQFTNGGFISTSSADATAGALRLGTAGTERLRIDTSGNVGIGTTSPTDTNSWGRCLDIRGTSTSGYAGTYFGNSDATVRGYVGAGGASGSGLAFIGTSTSTPLLFYTVNSERMRLDTSGNLGIGTSSPNAKLDVNVSANSAGYALAGWNFLAWNNSNELNYGGIGGGTWQALKYFTGGTERMRIDSSGNVGIGTTNILKRLSLDNNDSSTTTTPGLSITNFSSTVDSRAGITFRNFDNYGAAIWSRRTGSTAGHLCFGTNNTGGTAETNIVERMRIDESGRVLVGKNSHNQDCALEVQSLSTTTNSLMINQSNGSAGTTYKLITGWYGVFGSTAVESFRVWNNGNVQNTNNSYGSISDIKLKENIVDATPKLEKLNQVRVVNYNIKGETQKQIGVIAQELEQIFPSMIDESPDMDAEGNDLGTTTKSVKYSVFVPILIKALQEQQAIINDLTNRLTALENK